MEISDCSIRFQETIKLFKATDNLARKEKIVKIYNNIYIAAGAWVFNNTSELNIGIQHFQKIINLAPQEVEIAPLLTADVYSIDLLDVYDEYIYKYFDTLNELFALNKRENILIICAAGISRSPTIVLAYLLKQKFTLHNAINFLLSKRGQIRPNNGFLLQLIAYENSFRQNQQIMPLDLNSFDHILSILPEHVSFAVKEKKAINKAIEKMTNGNDYTISVLRKADAIKNKKKVSFDSKINTLNMCVWQFAYHEARKSEWMRIAADRYRFELRKRSIEAMLNKIGFFHPENRS